MQQASCILTETNQAPLALLKLTSETTGVFLILKRAAECALYNVEKIKAQSNSSALRRRLQFIAEIQVE